MFEHKKTHSSNISYIDYEADTIYYKLPLDIKDADYEIDKKGNITILVTNKIATFDKEFVGKLLKRMWYRLNLN